VNVVKHILIVIYIIILGDLFIFLVYAKYPYGFYKIDSKFGKKKISIFNNKERLKFT